MDDHRQRYRIQPKLDAGEIRWTMTAVSIYPKLDAGEYDD
jgi:hypothetical protein